MLERFCVPDHLEEVGDPQGPGKVEVAVRIGRRIIAEHPHQRHQEAVSLEQL
ncbi:hypothetical protein [Rhodococcus opacus]|uniref:hypothetical protein n=1 Tax=Rhodococcus opacus TaxID=37919 RepID=UPI001F4448EB|nr:hypothetical protein [Rhodococcus opacus]